MLEILVKTDREMKIDYAFLFAFYSCFGGWCAGFTIATGFNVTCYDLFFCFDMLPVDLNAEFWEGGRFR